MRANRTIVPVCAVLLLAAAACSGGGGKAGSAATDAVETSTTTTSTEAATTTVPPTSEAPTTVATTEPPTTPSTPAAVTEAPVTEAPTRPLTAVPTTAAGSGSGAAAEYTKVAGPTSPPKSAAVPANLIEDGETLNGPLPDGVYFGTLQGFRDQPTPGISIDTTQLLTGADCEAYAKQTGQECDDDYLVKNDPEGIYTLDVTPRLKITVAAIDGPGTSYVISYDELRRLDDGSPPAAGAPAGFTFTPFPFLYTVKNGVVTSIEQLWQP
jgi:hypothetical protein